MTKIISATHWKSSQLMNNKSYEISFYKDKDFQKVSLHSHDFYELYFFIKGNANYIIEDSYYKLNQGDILLVSPSDLHQLDIYDSKEDYERIVLWINPRYLKKLSTQRTDLSICFKLSNGHNKHLIRAPISSTIKELLLELYRNSKSESYGSDVFADILIKKVLLSLSEHAINAPHHAIEYNDSIVSKVMRYISDNLNSKLTLDILADSMFMSKYHLSRLFKNETNTTIHQYIIKKRLILSKRFLEQNLPVVEVFAKCGFSDYTHFFRAFKNEYGITPKEYSALIR